MGLTAWFKGVIQRMFRTDINREFGADPICSGEMDAAIAAWMNIYAGKPAWIDGDNGIETVNFAKTVCEETARLTTMAIGINVSGTRAEYMQKLIEEALYKDHRLRDWTEYGAAYGTVIFKPNGSGIDLITPDRFLITECDSNRGIRGIVFADTYREGDIIYTKHEYHRVEDRDGALLYHVSNRAYISRSEQVLGKQISLESTKWSGLQPETYIQNVREGMMMFGLFRMPNANNIDVDSALGMAIFANAGREMRGLDIAWSRNEWEIDNSNTIELLSDALIPHPFSQDKEGNYRLPSHVHNVMDLPGESFYQQIDRPLKTDIRKTGINMYLSQAGFKCGYSEGYFVFDEKSGTIATATQVESDDRRTIQLIKDIRDNLQSAIDGVLYAASVFADLYDLAPAGEYTVDYDWGDITYNYDEDRQRKYQLVRDGNLPLWIYLTKYEGFSEEEAKGLQKLKEDKEMNSLQLFASEE